MTDAPRRLPGAFVPALLLAATLLAWLTAPLAAADFERGTLAVESASGERHDFRIELALTDRQHAQGLMFRRQLAPDAGMLFVYRPVQKVSMWMKNTVIPLDMLFIAEDGRIVKVVERTVPLSLTPIASERPVRAVLELSGGTARRLGIRPGDRVHHPAFEAGS